MSTCTWPARIRGKVLMRSALAVVVCGIALALGLSLVVASPAEAAPRCKGNSCTGKGANAMGCSSDARTVREFSTINTRVELRYSPKCRAAWTRWTTRQSHAIGDTVFIRRHGARGHLNAEYAAGTKLDAGKSGSTKMIGRPRSGVRFQACNFINRDCVSWRP